MPDALTIDFALTGYDKIAEAFNGMAKMAQDSTTRLETLTTALNEATAAQRALNVEAEKYNRMAGSSAAINIGRGVAASNKVAGVASASSGFVSGPLQRQEKLAEQMTRALAQGNGRAVGDIGMAQARNEKAIERAMAGPKGIGGKLMDALKTSRFSVGGGASALEPLVGKTLGVIGEALGPEIMAVAGPVGIVAAAAATAAKALFDLTKASAEAGASYAKFSYAIGSNGPGAAKALSVGRMAGLDASGTASLAESLNSAITGSAMGRMFGQRAGISNYSGPFGGVDHADNLVKAIDTIRGMKSFDDRVRTMNELHLQPAAAAILMPQKQYDLHKQDAATTGGIMDQDFMQKSLAFQDSLSRLGGAFDNLMTVIGKPAMQSITNILDNVATGLNSFAAFLNSPAMQTAIKVLESSTVFGGLTAAAGGFEPVDTHTQALNENTRAQQQVTRSLDAVRSGLQQPGVYGHDSDGRLGRSFPREAGFDKDWRNRDQLMRSGYALGAF